jgi:hypothetical protein
MLLLYLLLRGRLRSFLLTRTQQDFEEAVQGIQQGYDDVRAGRTRPADKVIGDLGQKHGLAR